MVPPQGAMISFSIFMASRIKRMSPFFTVWPLLTRTSRMVPGMGAETFSPPAGAALSLAIVKKFEPLLLLPIAFGMLITNLPGAERQSPGSCRTGGSLRRS